MKQYDYLFVGAGLYSAVFAFLATSAGKKCLVVEKRDHIGGNIYCEMVEGIYVHKYGAHIFHTGNQKVWDFVNRFVEFNHFTNSPVANYKGKIYNLPFNMNTFSQMWGVSTPREAKAIIECQRAGFSGEPENLEEQAISLVGVDIYEKLVKGYTEKQWGRECKELPATIIKRLPVRYTYDNNYFDDPYQGIPVNGYNELIEKLFVGCTVETGVDYLQNRDFYNSLAKKIVYTGPIDAYFNFCLGKLEYRSLQFQHEVLNMDNYQGIAVMNFTEREIPYTRIIEHKHFAFGKQKKTVITREYPVEWKEGMEPYYAVNDERNQSLYQEYLLLAEREYSMNKIKVIFGGRLGEYKYYDMDKVIEAAMLRFEKECL